LSSVLSPKKETSVNVRLEVKEGGRMARKGYTPEQIINKPRKSEVLPSQGPTVGEAIWPMLMSATLT
jgi:hypothetical protein